MKMKTTLAALAVLAVSFTSAIAEEVTWTTGEVQKVDLAQSKVTVKHEDIKNLDMPAMTMVFKTSDPKMAKGLKVGDKIKMQVEDKGGKLTIMKLKK